MRRLGIVAVGLALVVGIVVGGLIGVRQGATADVADVTAHDADVNWSGAVTIADVLAALPHVGQYAVGARPVAEQNLDANGNIKVHEQGVVDVNVVSGGGGCYTNWNSADCAAGYAAVSTGEWTAVYFSANINVGSLICAAPKSIDTSSYFFRSATDESAAHKVTHEPCAICCK